MRISARQLGLPSRSVPRGCAASGRNPSRACRPGAPRPRHRGSARRRRRARSDTGWARRCCGSAGREPVPVRVHGRPELVEALGAVHRQGGGVGVRDGLVGLDQDHALAQAGDDLPEFMPVDARRHRSRTPCRARRPSGSRAQTGCAQAGSTALAFYTGIPASLTLSLSTRDKSAPFRRTCRPLRQCFHPIDTRASRAARRRKAGLADASDPVISYVHAQLGHRLRQYYSEVVAVDVGSRLAAVLDRLSAALDAAEAGGQVPDAFKDDLIALVPRLRRYALSLTFDGAEADDLVQFTLLKAWEHRERYEPGTDWSLGIHDPAQRLHQRAAQEAPRDRGS